MNRYGFLSKLTYACNVVCVALCGACGLIFTSLYLETFCGGFIGENAFWVETAVDVIIAFITLTAIISFEFGQKLLTKTLVLAVVSVFIITATLYFLKYNGFTQKAFSVEALREYVAGFGNFAVFHFIFIQFLQVVVLPIPSFITVAAGVMLFGAFWGSVYSCIGIISGSLMAYIIGKSLGYKAICWILGRKNVEKWTEKLKGKDKLLFTLMFLLPFFPDDLLCFIAGITALSPLFFTVMIIFTRVITVFASSYSINNQLIPYDTWWGALIWIVFLVFTVAVTFAVYKRDGKRK